MEQIKRRNIHIFSKNWIKIKIIYYEPSNVRPISLPDGINTAPDNYCMMHAIFALEFTLPQYLTVVGSLAGFKQYHLHHVNRPVKTQLYCIMFIMYYVRIKLYTVYSLLWNIFFYSIQPVIKRRPSGVQLRQKIGQRILLVAVFTNLENIYIYNKLTNFGT